ncbi:MAG: aspartate kinase [Acidaminococcaceae bacterium]|nr:aspartate kinase [Acidaminococcaceae bacterium]
MAILVKKFGGSSVATPEKMHGIVDRVLNEKKPGDRVVLVVSAMGDSTDDLLELASKVAPNMPKRELDMLLSTGEQVSVALMAGAFISKGQPAISFTGGQAGILTSDVHTKATILNVDAKRVKEALEEGKVVIVAGFQGVTGAGDITTLGRGGSDTTAVAVAAGIRADFCEIYTDVDGVYTADPRIAPGAKKMEEITFAEMLELARLGAGVMQPRAVEYGEHNGVAIHVRSTFKETSGTIIREECTVQEKNFVIRGVAHDTNVAKIAVKGVPDQPGVAYKIFSALAAASVDVDMIIQSFRDADGTNDILFTVVKTDLVEATSVVESLKEKMGGFTFDVEINVAKVSIVGAGMLGSPGIAAGMFGALADAGINIAAISTSEISISCLIKASDVKEAVNAIHKHFFEASE